MRVNPIPGWTLSGVLPPINPASPTSTDRSPYQIGIFDFALRFGTSTDRNRSLLGLLEYRQVLRELGIAQGFQWIDGSFLEDVERLEGRVPNDLDVVTFAHLPSGVTQRDLIARRQSFRPEPLQAGLSRRRVSRPAERCASRIFGGAVALLVQHLVAPPLGRLERLY